MRRGSGCLMRLVYLDEAGISHEETTVVAGLIVEPDRQYLDLEARVRALIKVKVPESHQVDYAFHATELISGGKKKNSAFPRAGTNTDVRWPILEHLLLMPRACQLPFIVGYHRKGASATSEEETLHAHAVAYAMCALGVNEWMKQNAPNEWALMIAEDREGARGPLQRAHSLYRDGRFRRAMVTGDPFDWSAMGSHMRDHLLFAAKGSALPLQVADAIACIVRREIDGVPRNETFIRALFGEGGDLDWDSYSQRENGYRTYDVLSH